MRTVALTGATGFVGMAAARHFVEAGWQVRALFRQNHPNIANVEWIRGSLNDANSLASLLQNSEVVVHIAGLINGETRSQFVEVNFDGTKRLVEAALDKKIDRFIYISSLAATRPNSSVYGETKSLAENIVLTSGLNTTVIRPPAIYGENDKDFPKIFSHAKKYRFVPILIGGRTSIISVEDLSRLLVSTASRDDINGEIYEPCDGRMNGWAHHQLTNLIGRAMQTRLLSLPMPKAAFKVYARKEIKKYGFEHANLTPDRAAYMVEKLWVANSNHAVPDHVWRPAVKSEDGLRSAYQWHVKNPSAKRPKLRQSKFAH
jgi:uncharacterized protein YbjT (DUF2867 family)